MPKLTKQILDALIKETVLSEKESVQSIVNFDLVFSGKNAKNQKILTDIASNLRGDNLFQSLKNIKLFLDPNTLEETMELIKDADNDGKKVDDQISNYFSNIIAISTLNYLTNLDQSAMGFYLESWFAMIIAGERTGGEGDAVDFVDAGGTNYSAKFIIDTSAIGQESAREYDEKENPEPIYYIVALKDSPTKINNIKFYAFKAIKSKPQDMSDFVAGKEITENGISILEIPFSNLYKNKGNMASNYNNAKPFVVYDLNKIRADLPKLADNIKANEKTIFQNINSFIENIDALKILLGFYFQTFDNAVPKDIAATAENCKDIVNFFNSKKDDYTGDQVKDVPASADEIIADNKELVEYEQLPDITTNQSYNMLTRGGTNPSADATLDQIKNNITGKNHEEKIKSFCDQFNNLITQTVTFETAKDYQKIFSILVAAQSIYRIVEEVFKGGEAGSGGFSMENFISMFIGSTEKSGVYGGNQELADIVDYDQETNTVYGYSSKFKKARPGNPILRYLIDDKGGKVLTKNDFKNYGNEGLFDTIQKLKFSSIRNLTTYNDEEQEIYKYYVSRTNKPLSDHNGAPLKTIKQTIEAIKNMNTDQKSQFIDDVLNLRRDEKPGTSEFNFNDIVSGLTGGTVKKPDNVTYTEITVDQIGKRDAEGIMNFDTISDIAFYKQEFVISTAELESGKFAQRGASGEGKELFAILNFSKTNFTKVVENITKSLNNSNYDFTSIFKEFNTFKLAMYSFFQNPDVAYIDTALKSYTNMKTPINKLFSEKMADSAVSIEENKFEQLDLMIENMVKQFIKGKLND